MILGDADDLLGALIPLAAIFFVFGAPVAGWVIIRAMAHRERMEMLRQGIAPAGQAGFRVPNAPYVPNNMSAPRAPVPPAPPVYDENDVQCTLRKGISVFFIGMALTVGLSFIGYHDGPFGPSVHPGPWLLGGLIPMFVGLAQITTALLSGATLRPMQRGGAAPQPNLYSVPPPQAPPPPQPPPASPTYEGSYTYRPGGAQELRKPNDIERS
jgi:hypothetical protein